MFAVKLVISIKLRMFNEYTTYPLAKIGSCYGKLLSWIWQTKFLWLDNLSNNPSWKSGKHGNNIRHSQLIHLPNMSILTMLEAYSNNLHELATVYWGQKKSQIKSGKFEFKFPAIIWYYLSFKAFSYNVATRATLYKVIPMISEQTWRVQTIYKGV